MELETQPQPGRATISANKAHRLLGYDRRTIQKMIVAGTLQGGARPGKQRRWYVYLDQFEQNPPPPASKPSPTDYAAVVEENNQLRAGLISANEENALLRAAHAEILDAVASHRAAIDDALQGADAFRQAFAKSETGWQHLSKAISLYNSALGQYTTPGDLSALER
ncbi:hypothetical protein [Mycobacterium intracellulare]|uniref:Helix-turn-helix domain-containing protein n=1 Tax=Mycobacterium intracellulare subsp. chimaera TaxID=222805 RepID=A0A7U5RYE2_MYCIT|nr:hypothetical protein [Mycobacterium intracellulare]ASL18302.1 hypothetical protein MYCOZU2_05957 [Mycobacterium intracellulare subsp. chimaera]